jgi:hypothetical protein
MTLHELQSLIWRDLPVRKRIAGRDTINDLVQLAVESWPVEYMNAATSDNERQIVSKEVERSVKRLHHACTNVDGVSYGIVWNLLLQALVTGIVQWLLKWWLERRANRVVLMAMQYELTK